MKVNVILNAVIAVLFIILLYTCDKAKRVETQLETSQAEAKYWQDEKGRSNAEILVLKVDNFQLGKLADSLRSVKIKPRTVTRVETITTHSTDTVTITVGRFGNKWASFSIAGDRLAYSFTDSLALVTHVKRVGLFRKAYVTRAVSFNPYTRLTGITSTEILPKERRLSIGLYTGYGLHLSGGVVRYGWGAGVGITFRIF